MCRTIDGSCYLYMCPKYMHNVKAHWEYVSRDKPPTREDVELFIKLRDEFNLVPDDEEMMALFDQAEKKYVTALYHTTFLFLFLFCNALNGGD